MAALKKGVENLKDDGFEAGFDGIGQNQFNRHSQTFFDRENRPRPLPGKGSATG